MIIPNLLLIAGTGTKSGKTSLACKIIEQFNNIDITAIKISPHFHETTAGLISKSEKKGYSIYEETNRDTSKDTSRMLHSGAHKVFFAKVWDDQLLDVFNEIMTYIPSNVPVICESPALRNYIEPGVFIIMTSNIVNKQKNINYLQTLPHIMLKYEELDRIDSFSIGFENGKWFFIFPH
ncbi:MAG: hypothetical protein NT144_04540 [Bacteroidia bacterium]|nr:hypothetical protein [Bacteroidia bacterium]